jgi:ubiquinone biosynthesis protein UbiJ
VAFEDQLDPAAPPRGRRSRTPGGPRPFLARRLIALGVGVVLLILVLLGIRGCLDARKERSFENYASDLSSIVTQANQLAASLFETLRTPPDKNGAADLEAEVAAARGALEGLLQRVENLDTPDELAEGESEMVSAFKLRRDALAGMSDQLPAALGRSDRYEPLAAIAGDMRALLASDVLYERARAEIQQVLEDEGIAATVEESIFLPEPVDQWIDVNTLAVTLAPFAADASATSGVHGLALLSSRLDNTTLSTDAENTVNLNGLPQLEVEVQNGGDSDEVDVSVSYTLSGASGATQGVTTISRIGAGQTQSATIAFAEEPPTGTPLTLEISVLPVPGETLFENNTLTYTVTFE